MAGVVVLSISAVPGAADESTGETAHQTSDRATGCVAMKGLKEEILDGSMRDLGGRYPYNVGGSATYFDRLTDADGKRIATVYGRANIPSRLENGDMAEYSDERIEFSDGAVEAQGIYDITKAEKGAWQYLPVVGIEGRYRGMLGKRHFQITKMGKSLNGWIELCPAKSSSSVK
ncbi:allene oxide cyclase barrel-like domain-containing protein [Streptomyces glebosus]|uniref:allene oxide cyclase barrel-like domain-containing protein n=1 Tax=Streptomyces glebosus TaxID=249580 RepID=UPI00167EE6F0|nr:hypothetical protein [Streptomyces glebosus]